MPAPPSEFATFVVEQMSALGGVQARRMFGGYGIFLDGLMFALIVDDGLYFKVDGETVARYNALGLPPFRYAAKGKTVALRYHEAPPEVFEDAQVMAAWAGEAYACALRNQQPRPPRSTSGAQRRRSG